MPGNKTSFNFIAINVNQLNRYDWNLTSQKVFLNLNGRNPEFVSREIVNFINTTLENDPAKAIEMRTELSGKIAQKLMIPIPRSAAHLATAQQESSQARARRPQATAQQNFRTYVKDII